MTHFAPLSLRRLALSMGIAATLALMPVTAPAAVTAFKQAVAETSARDAEIAAFYRARGFAPLWTGEGPEFVARRQALLDALGQVSQHGLPTSHFSPEALLARMGAVKHDRDLGQIEVELSRLYLEFARDVQTGILTPTDVESGIKREAPLRDRTQMLTDLANGDAAQVMAALPPHTPEYLRLMREKIRLERVIAAGGWGPAVKSGKLSLGDTGPAVVALRNRLIRMGYMPVSATASFDSALEAALTRFQGDVGITPDGVAGDGTLAEVNRSPAERLKSVLVAMERERWMNFAEGRGERHVFVNLTEFKARIIDHGRVTFETRAVVGDRDLDRRTPEFSDVMEMMVINPSWHVPRSIVVKEYLPRLRNNPGAVGHLQIIDRRGRVVSRSEDFAQYSSGSFPFAMRQPPGPGNALGVVKFLFPNKYNIYLHDTPAKDLFNREVRAFSHGCIRLADPKDFAYALLARQSDDPVDYFQSRLRTGAETRVDLMQPIPVHLDYRTAFTSAKGRTQYRPDIYGRDAKVWDALSAQGVALPGAEG